MPFRVDWDDAVKAEIVQLARTGHLDVVIVRMLSGSFPHDRWLNGELVSLEAPAGAETRQLTHGPITLVYELYRETETVRVIAIARS